MKTFKLFVLSVLLSPVFIPISSFATEGETQEESSKQEEVVPITNVKTIFVKDINVPTGEKWNQSLAFDYIELTDGTKLTWADVESEIQVTGDVNTDVAGVYPVTYTYKDQSKIANVTVKIMEVVKVQQIILKDITLPRGTAWQASDSFEAIKMSDGTSRNWEDVSKEIVVVGEVENQQIGDYKVTYTYEGVSATSTVTVKDMEVLKVQEISLKNTTVNRGMAWDASQNFDFIMLSNGVKLTWNEVKEDVVVTSDIEKNDAGLLVDTKKDGVYKLTYTYLDKSAVASVTVQDMEVIKVQQIIVKDSTISLNSKWQATDNFVSVKMSDGTERSWADVSKEIQTVGNVDTTKVGVYKVTYTYQGQIGVATITVTEKGILPQTGETTNQLLLVAGIIVILFGLGLVTYRISRKRRID